jgi:predicted CopG family antitoxin
MATKTISLSEDAYDRLAAAKREGESFSDVVRRLTAGVGLSAFHGALSAETAGQLEARVAERRAQHTDDRQERLDRLVDELE